MSITATGKNKWLYAIAGLIITANIVTLALLWVNHKKDNDQHRRRPGQDNTFNYISNELKFDSKQKASYETLRDEHRKAAHDLEDSLRKSKDELFTLLSDPNADANAVQAKANRSAAFSASLDTVTFYHFKKVRLLCNPDQQKKFDEIINEAIHHMGGGPHGPPPPPQRNF